MSMHDAHRPQFHFQPTANWMNDPNGVIQWKGTYHLFYQYNPAGPLFGVIHWGHAMSKDLVHWQHLPIALTPTPDSVDAEGCWSGCMVNNNGTPTIIYSGNYQGRQLPCIATSSDEELIHWTKYTGNPVISAPPAELEIGDFRDHCVWREGEHWYQLIGSGIKGAGGTALLYRSQDLLHWDYLHPLCVGDPNQTGTMWECPDFFPLGDKYVLVVSAVPQGITYYFIGTYHEQHFYPETTSLIDYGKHFYAPQSMRDDQGRRLMWGWLREGRDDQQLQKAGWAGMMSLPRVLSLDQQQRLVMAPAPEIEVLREQHVHQEAIEITPQAQNIASIEGTHCEIKAELQIGNAQICGLQITSVETDEYVLLSYDRPQQKLTVTYSPFEGQLPYQPGERESGVVQLDAEQRLHLHIFFDGSVLEVFANGVYAVTERIYLQSTQQLQVSVFTSEGTARLHALDAWTLRSIWS